MAQINILDIPTELLVKICANLQFRDLSNLELSSQHFRSLIVEHQLYRKLHTDCRVFNNIISRERVEEMKEREKNMGQEDSVLQSRLYKSLLVQLYRPDHYHCKGAYQEYVQVFQEEELRRANKENVSQFWIQFYKKYLLWIALLILLLVALFILTILLERNRYKL
eukprot:GFUD01011769.1.p1 GENE.GFUD01011769.1~~GFUD01011769.1.p1  ORF type:complete len:166 (+),score=59.93 GFUD01011769.1:208-705(+)